MWCCLWLGPKPVFLNWCGALYILTDPSLWLLLLWLLWHPAPTALPPQMIVSTSLLRVCLSVRPRWFGFLCCIWLQVSLYLFMIPLHTSSPPIPDYLSTLWSSPVSRVQRLKHGAFLTGSDRSRPSVSSTNQYLPLLSLLSNHFFRLEVRCSVSFYLDFGGMTLLVVWHRSLLPSALSPLFSLCLNCVLRLPVGLLLASDLFQQSSLFSILYNLYCMSLCRLSVRCGLTWCFVVNYDEPWFLWQNT